LRCLATIPAPPTYCSSLFFFKPNALDRVDSVFPANSSI